MAQDFRLIWIGEFKLLFITQLDRLFCAEFFKVGHSGPLFVYFRLFNTGDSKQMFNKNFADDWISKATALPTEPQPLPAA